MRFPLRPLLDSARSTFGRTGFCSVACAAVLAVTSSACGLAEKDVPPPPPAPKIEVSRFAVELREKTNTCAPLDSQVSRDTFAIHRLDDQAIIVAGTDRVFSVDVLDAPTSVSYAGTISEPDRVRKKCKNAVICKRVTVVDIEQKDGRLSGSYTRRFRQECVEDGCEVTFSVDGRLP